MTAYDKPQWWNANASFLREYAPKDSSGRVQNAYIGLAGSSCQGEAEALRALLPDPKLFLAVDRDPTLIFGHLLAGREFRIASGNFFDVANEEIEKGQPSAALFSFDGTSEAGPNFWITEGKRLKETISRSVKRNGYACLILNLSLTRRTDPISKRPFRLWEHTDAFVKCFREWKPEPREIYQTNIPVSNENDGRAGAYQVYRSEGHPTLMVTLRVRFNERTLKIHNAVRY